MTAKEFLDGCLGWECSVEGQPPDTIKYHDVIQIMTAFELTLRLDQLKETSNTNPLTEMFNRVEEKMKKYRTENY